MFCRKSLVVVTIILLLCMSSKAQTPEKKSSAFTKGSWELNLSGDMGSQTSKTKYESAGNSEENSSDDTYFQLHIIPGYFIIDGLSFEPELDFLFVKENKPSYSLVPMLSYTYLLPNNPKLALYVRGGYGLTNSFNYFGVLIRRSDALDIGVFSLGGGLKFLPADNICFRTEVNYRTATYTNEETFNYGPGMNYSYKSTNTLSNIRLLLGLSILL